MPETDELSRNAALRDPTAYYETVRAQFRSKKASGEDAHSEWKRLIEAQALRTIIGAFTSKVPGYLPRTVPGESVLRQPDKNILATKLREAFAALEESVLSSEQADKLELLRLIGHFASNAPSMVETHIVEMGDTGKLPVVHSANITGEVVEVDEWKAVVTFSQDGETELRDFPWSMVKGGKGRLAVGDRVKAYTELELIPRKSDGEVMAASKEIHSRAENFAKGLKGASAPPITVEAQQAADSAREKV